MCVKGYGSSEKRHRVGVRACEVRLAVALESTSHKEGSKTLEFVRTSTREQRRSAPRAASRQIKGYEFSKLIPVTLRARSLEMAHLPPMIDEGSIIAFAFIW